MDENKLKLEIAKELGVDPISGESLSKKKDTKKDKNTKENNNKKEEEKLPEEEK